MSEPMKILLVEDDDIDAEAVQRAFRRERIANTIRRVTDGRQALEVLRGGAEERPTQPFIILLDLALPRMSGFEFLEHVRGDEALRRSVVFVLTTSSADRDRCEAYKHNIAGYLVKNAAGKEFVELVRLLGAYWRYVEFPPEIAT